MLNWDELGLKEKRNEKKKREKIIDVINNRMKKMRHNKNELKIRYKRNWSVNYYKFSFGKCWNTSSVYI